VTHLSIGQWTVKDSRLLTEGVSLSNGKVVITSSSLVRLKLSWINSRRISYKFLSVPNQDQRCFISLASDLRDIIVILSAEPSRKPATPVVLYSLTDPVLIVPAQPLMQQPLQRSRACPRDLLCKDLIEQLRILRVDGGATSDHDTVCFCQRLMSRVQDEFADIVISFVVLFIENLLIWRVIWPNLLLLRSFLYSRTSCRGWCYTTLLEETTRHSWRLAFLILTPIMMGAFYAGQNIFHIWRRHRRLFLRYSLHEFISTPSIDEYRV
jgi:hypothetical protein